MNLGKRKYWIGSFFTLLFFLLLYLIQAVESQDPSSSIKNMWDAFWYSIVTLTTVGYGDSYPVTVSGKILGLILILMSLGLLSVLIGNIASQINRYMERKKLGFFGTDQSDHIVIVGWNEIGRLIVEQVVQAGQSVVVVSEKKEAIERLNEDYPERVFGVHGEKVWSLESVERAKMNQASSIYINVSDDSSALVTLINIRQQCAKAQIVVRLTNTDLKSTFLNAGATYIIPEQEISSKLAASFLFEPEVALFTEDLITTAGEDKENFDLQQYRVSEDSPVSGWNYGRAFTEIKKDYNAILVGLSKGQKLHKNPADDTPIDAGDYLLLIANGASQEQLEKAFGVKQGR